MADTIMNKFEAHIMTAKQIAEGVRYRELSAVDVLSFLFDRIERLEPQLKAWITLDREGAFQTARNLEKALDNGKRPGLLCGVPIGIKDVFYTAGLKTTAGSPLFADYVPSYDATCVAKLRQQDAIIMGKTMTTEFALADPCPTRNPWNLIYNPGGSSTGSAVAVAARMCPVGLANQTGGSTLRPASYNGVVGFKPTYGRISNYGVFSCAWSNDTIGMMVRSVEDAALVFQVTAGYDPLDPSTYRLPVEDCITSLQTDQKPPRLGLLRDYFLEKCDKETRRHVEATAQRLASEGADIQEVELPSVFQKSASIHMVLGSAEFAAIHEKSVRAHPESYSPHARALAETGMLIPAVTYLQAQRLKRRYRMELDELASRFDSLLTPTTPTPPGTDLSNTGDPKFQNPWTLSGLPTISLPSGLSSEGLPMAIQLISKGFSEAHLLAVAQWCESILNFRLAPPIV